MPIDRSIYDCRSSSSETLPAVATFLYGSDNNKSDKEYDNSDCNIEMTKICEIITDKLR